MYHEFDDASQLLQLKKERFSIEIRKKRKVDLLNQSRIICRNTSSQISGMQSQEINTNHSSISSLDNFIQKQLQFDICNINSNISWDFQEIISLFQSFQSFLQSLNWIDSSSFSSLLKIFSFYVHHFQRSRQDKSDLILQQALQMLDLLITIPGATEFFNQEIDYQLLSNLIELSSHSFFNSLSTQALNIIHNLILSDYNIKIILIEDHYLLEVLSNIYLKQDEIIEYKSKENLQSSFTYLFLEILIQIQSYYLQKPEQLNNPDSKTNLICEVMQIICQQFKRNYLFFNNQELNSLLQFLINSINQNQYEFQISQTIKNTDILGCLFEKIEQISLENEFKQIELLEKIIQLIDYSMSNRDYEKIKITPSQIILFIKLMSKESFSMNLQILRILNRILIDQPEHKIHLIQCEFFWKQCSLLVQIQIDPIFQEQIVLILSSLIEGICYSTDTTALLKFFEFNGLILLNHLLEKANSGGSQLIGDSIFSLNQLRKTFNQSRLEKLFLNKCNEAQIFQTMETILECQIHQTNDWNAALEFLESIDFTKIQNDEICEYYIESNLRISEEELTHLLFN